MRLRQRAEGERLREGVNYNESLRSYYIDILKGENKLSIRIPKDSPKDYELVERVKEKWVQKLWL